MITFLPPTPKRFVSRIGKGFACDRNERYEVDRYHISSFDVKWPKCDTGQPPANPFPEAHNGDVPDNGGGAMVTGDAVVEMARSQIDHYYSGDYDLLNGNHEWPWWCESYVESTHRQLGLDVSPQESALSASRAYPLQQGRPPAGAAMFFYSDNGSWSQWGHTAISLGDGSCVGTVTDSRGVAVNWWNETTPGFLGYYLYPGVADREPDPPPAYSYRVPDNPYETEDCPEIIIGGGFYQRWQSVGADPLVVLGYPMGNEHQALCASPGETPIQRTVQYFERAILIYDATVAAPWDVTTALRSATITPL
jgi:hypothetical protein